LAVPVFNNDGVKNKVVGILVIIVDAFPTQRDIPVSVMIVAG
jgi:hypothetical protein